MTTQLGMTEETYEQIKQTYRRMVKEGKYAPMAPSDGMGGIIGDQDTEAEAEAYVEAWWNEEGAPELSYSLGCPDWSRRPALIFAVEACRNLCGINYTTAIKLLKMAVAELENPKGPSFTEYSTKLGIERPDYSNTPIEEIFPPMD